MAEPPSLCDGAPNREGQFAGPRHAATQVGALASSHSLAEVAHQSPPLRGEVATSHCNQLEPMLLGGEYLGMTLRGHRASYPAADNGSPPPLPVGPLLGPRLQLHEWGCMHGQLRGPSAAEVESLAPRRCGAQRCSWLSEETRCPPSHRRPPSGLAKCMPSSAVLPLGHSPVLQAGPLH